MLPRYMAEREQQVSRSGESEAAHRRLDLDVPSLETALQATSEERLDWHLGRGVIFRLGQPERASLELYPQIVRVSLPQGQLSVSPREAEVVPEGVVFQDPDQYFLSVGPSGEVLFQYWPTSASASAHTAVTSEHIQPARSAPAEATRAERRKASPSSPAAGSKEKAKSERHVGRLGEVKSHRTKQGKLVAEVELTVPDPERPGASQLVKFVAFGEKADVLQREYQPGQEVTAVGIPHELPRLGKDGREWTERQLYLVQLPKPR
jgi:hypothetical protein